MEVTHRQLRNVIRRVWKTRMPLFIWGTTGIGKSQMVRESAKNIASENELKFTEDIRDLNDERKFSLVDIRVSQLDPTDLRGLPIIDKGSTKWVSPNWLPKAGKGILFFDELNLAPPSIQASAYQLILDRRLGNYVLPEGYIIVSAGNRLEDRANVFELPAPLRNRFLHAQLKIPVARSGDPESKEGTWTDWAIRNKLDQRIVGFLNFRPTLLFGFDPEAEDNAFPTPRSWEFTSKLIKGIKDKDELRILTALAVGQGTAEEFRAFVGLQEKMDLDAVINDPRNANIPEKPDMLYALVAGIAESYSSKNVKNFLILLTDVLPAEYAMLLAKLLYGGTTFVTDKNTAGSYKTKFVKRFGKYLIGW